MTKSRPAQDHTGESLFGSPSAHPAVAADKQPAREYDNAGNGLSKESGQNYNEAHGRKANAPTSGGDRQAAYDALLSPEDKRVPVAYLG